VATISSPRSARSNTGQARSSRRACASAPTCRRRPDPARQPGGRSADQIASTGRLAAERVLAAGGDDVIPAEAAADHLAPASLHQPQLGQTVQRAVECAGAQPDLAAGQLDHLGDDAVAVTLPVRQCQQDQERLLPEHGLHAGHDVSDADTCRWASPVPMTPSARSGFGLRAPWCIARVWLVPTSTSMSPRVARSWGPRPGGRSARRRPLDGRYPRAQFCSCCGVPLAGVCHPARTTRLKSLLT